MIAIYLVGVVAVFAVAMTQDFVGIATAKDGTEKFQAVLRSSLINLIFSGLWPISVPVLVITSLVMDDSDVI
jgi:hypothetical protein